MPKTLFSLPPLPLTRDSRLPLAEQIARELSEAIRSRAAIEPSRLPSTRSLAASLGVSRNTVVDAYERLREERLVEGRRGSGMWVRPRKRPATPVGERLRKVAAAAHWAERALRIADPDGHSLRLHAYR